MTFLTFVAPLAAIGLVRGDIDNALDCCVVENISANSWWLHAPALLLLVLPQKSNMLPDLSASELYSHPPSCGMSCVTCQMSDVTCCMSQVFSSSGPIGEASRLRVCYQRGLPRIV